MKIEVNGDPVSLDDAATITELLTQLQQEAIGVAVAVNQTIVDQTSWASFLLSEGDRVAIFRAIAGG